MENADAFVERMTGEALVYPGHPMVVAVTIMNAFASFEEANKPSPPSGFTSASCSGLVLGAGCHVHGAMTALKIGAEGGSIDDMVASACDYWERGGAGGHVNNVASGRLQAQAMEPHFRELAKSWFAKQPAH